MEFEDLIDALSKRIGVELQVTDEGTCALAVDDMSVTVQNVPEAYGIGFFGKVGDPPPQGLAPLQTAMLDANHLFRGTGGATLSRDPETGAYYLCRTLDARNLDGDGFCDALEKFVNVLEAWCRLLADYRPEAEQKQDAEDEPPAFGRGILQV